MLAGVGGVVDAGLVAGTGGHEERFIGRESYYGTEVERFGTGDPGGRPSGGGVGGAEVGAVGAGGPSDILRDGAYAAKVFGGMGGMTSTGRLGEGGRGCEEKHEKR